MKNNKSKIVKILEDEEAKESRTGYPDVQEDERGEAYITLKWTAADVYAVAEEIGIELDSNQMLEVLHDLIHNHDAGIGINWDVIEAYIRSITGTYE